MPSPHNSQTASLGDNPRQADQQNADRQDTGNHKQPGSEDAGCADRVGGTRAGAENIEPVQKRPKPE